MNPKINVWATGPDAGGDAIASIRRMFSAVPPILDAANQAGITLPGWMPQKGASAGDSGAVNAGREPWSEIIKTP